MGLYIFERSYDTIRLTVFASRPFGSGVVGSGCRSRLCRVDIPPTLANPSVMIRHLLKHLLMLAGLMAGSPSSATTVGTILDTTPTWDGTSGVGPFGDNGIETYGQTFVAPAQSRLNQITLYVNDETNSGTVSNPAYLDFKVYVMAWAGTKAAGSILFQSPSFTTTNNHGPGGMERFDVSTGGVNLVAGGSYVFFLSDSGLFDGNASTGAIGFLGEFAPDVYSGGEFVAIDNQQDTSKWTTAAWTKYFPGKDLAFTLSFAPAPEPGTTTLLILGSLALLRHRR